MKLFNIVKTWLLIGLLVCFGQIKAQMSGTFTVGMGGNFLDLTSAYNTLVTYGINGPVTLSVISNLHGKQLLIDSVPGTSSTNTITITSSTGNANSFIVGTDSLYALCITDRVKNILIKDLTIGVTNDNTQQYGVYFERKNYYVCDNIEFRGCNINSYVNATTSAYAAIYYDGISSTNYYIKNIRFIKNKIKGGYYNIYLDYPSGDRTIMALRQGITIDSNELIDAYYYGVYSNSYAYYSSISYNTIKSRSNSSTYYGIYTYYYTTVDTMQSNRINVTGTSDCYGMRLYAYQNHSTTFGAIAPMFIANNEIIIQGSSTAYGIYHDDYYTFSELMILNNSIYISNTSTAYGLYWYPQSSSYYLTFKNNIIHLNTSGTAYLLFYRNSSYWSTSYSSSDYNNYYRTGSGTTTYYGISSCTSLSAWQSSSQDLNTTSIATDFNNINKSLELNNYTGLTCPLIANLTRDLRNNPRTTTTFKGCYVPFALDACIISGANTISNGEVNDSSSVSVLLQNVGLDTIRSANIYWKFKDSLRAHLIWTGILPPSQGTNITLENIYLTYGYTNPLQVWVSNLNASADMNSGNDTLSLNIFGCSPGLNGYYTVGENDADFKSIDDAIAAINICGVSGPVTFALNNGTYNQSLELTTPLLSGINETNTLTFTSVSGIADSVRIFAAGTTLTLDSVSHLRFKHITIGVNSIICEKAVVFNKSCSDIEFSHCIINVDTFSSDQRYIGISYGNSDNNPNYLTNVKFINNTINGGYYNFYFKYAAGSNANIALSGMSVTIDSNRLMNAYRYGIYSNYYARYPSISYNNITSRNSDSVTIYWYGIYLYAYQNVRKIAGNKIYSFNGKINRPIGIYIYAYFNYLNSNGEGSGYIFNNEIILKGYYNGTDLTYFSGIVLSNIYANIEVYHNSIYLHGTYPGVNYGSCIYLHSGNNTYNYKIQNNNLVSSIVSGANNYIYSLYCYHSSASCIRDFNNYYMSNYNNIVRISSSNYTLSSLRSAFSQDANSTNVNAGFTPGISSLYPVLWTSCPTLPIVPLDKNGVLRNRLPYTYMGCYHPNFSNDAGVRAFVDIAEKSTVGINSIKVKVYNFGTDTIKSLILNHSINGTLQTPVSITGLSLASYEDTLITIGSFTAGLGVTTHLKAWTSNPNGKSDDFMQNDTLSLATEGCSNVLSGTYDIAGGNNDFSSWGAALAALNNCGVSGPVVFRLASGVYDSLNLFNTVIQGTSSENTITFTSLANNADSVVIGASNGPALTLNATAHLRFEKITIGNPLATTYGVNFLKINENIAFYHCIIHSHSSIASTGYACVNYNNTDTISTLKNIRFIGNTLKGGYYNFYFNNAKGSETNMSSMAIVIDSNQLLQSYYYGIYSNNYAYFKSISHNSIKARNTDSLSYFWYGIYLSPKNSVDNLVGNCIHSLHASLYYPNGIFIDSMFNVFGSFLNSPLIANNEVIINSVGQVNGIQINAPYSNVRLLHNSVYMYGTGNPNALCIKNPSKTFSPVIKNNLLITAANFISFPIYYQGNYNFPYIISDYNNYYSTGNYFGYAGGPKNSLSTLQLATGQDVHSVSIQPNFYNLSSGLEYKDSLNLTCLDLQDVLYDINGKSRAAVTLIGAYGLHNYDVSLSSFISPLADQKLCQFNHLAVTVKVINTGHEDISFQKSPLHIYWEISGVNNYQKDSIIHTGGLSSLQSINIGLLPNPIFNDTGLCHIKVYIDYIDYNKLNDTLNADIHIIPVQSRDTLTICNNELPLTYGDSIFYAAGNYAIDFHSFYGCDSTVYLCLNVNPAYNHTDTLSICSNQLPYLYGDSIFYAAGNYAVHFKTIKGCDSLVTLRLYVNPSYSKTDTLTICSHQLPYYYGDSILLAAGSYNIHFNTITGCDSLVVLRLYVNPTYSKTDTISICANELPYHYGDSIFYAAGNYTIHYKTIKACDSLVNLRLNVYPTYSKFDTVSICNNQLPYHYGDSIFYTAGSYAVHFKTLKGCDSLITLRLYVNPSYSKTDTLTICSNQLPYHYGDSTLLTAGSYNIHFKTIKGCDSLVVLRLYVNPTYSKTDTISICANELPYHYGDSTFYAAGNYTIHYKTIKACDSLVNLRLNVYPAFSKFDTLSICNNQLPYHYGDSILYTAGSFAVHFKTLKGCDSLVSLRLYVHPSYSKTDTVSICSNQLPYHYGDSTLLSAGSYNIHFKTIKGCDSLVVLRLYVNPTYSKTDTISICANELPYHYGDSTLYAVGNYAIHFKTIKGCDSLVNLRLNVYPTYSKFDTVSICGNQLPYYYGDSIFYTAGSYSVHFKTIKGCDSLVTLRLYVNPSYSKTDTVSICSNQLPYHYGDSTLLAAGSYDIHFKTIKGCDSLVVLRLYVNPTYSKTDTISICANELPYHYGDSTLFTAGNYNIHFKTIAGCDSLIILRLYVYPLYSHNDTITVCESQLPYTYGDSIINNQGNYSIHFKSINGCDSLINLTLYTDTIYKINKTANICDNELPYIFRGNTYYTSGTYNIRFTSLSNCDTIVQLKLVVNSTYQHSDTLSICMNELPYHYGDSLLSNAGTYNIHFTTIAGCDSLITLCLYVNPTYAKNDTLTICQHELPYHYGDSILYTAGNHNIRFISLSGCDSLVILRLYVNPTYNTNDTLTICQNQLPYQYGDSTFYTAGNYNIQFKTIAGCDSSVALRLFVNPIYTTNETLTICQNELPYVYSDSILTAAGSYSIHFKTIYGCDSVVLLKLNVNPTFISYDTITICSAHLPYHYGDSILHSPGNYSVHFTSTKGCDSLVMLTFYVDTFYKFNQIVSVCENNLPYQFGDSVFYAAGTYDVYFKSQTDCDTIIKLKLNVYPRYSRWDTIHICDNELPYHYTDSIFSKAGNYVIPLQSVLGCDSIIHLTLYVNPTFKGSETVTICEKELPYHYGDSTFTAAGEYDVHFTALTTCDSLIRLKLHTIPTPAIPSKISGDTLITQANIYTYEIDPVNGALSYVWTLFNHDWVGSSTTESIDIYIPKAGTGMISVKAENQCGLSKASTLSIYSSISVAETDADNWKLGQNIPNPASRKTIIPYYIPEEGEVLLQVISISGQLLYSEKHYVDPGNHQIELNIDLLSDGIYYYSMEYKKQRIIKKMTIQK